MRLQRQIALGVYSWLWAFGSNISIKIFMLLLLLDLLLISTEQIVVFNSDALPSWLPLMRRFKILFGTMSWTWKIFLTIIADYIHFNITM